MQLIVFFNREKFYTLVENHGNEAFKKIYFKKRTDPITGSERTILFNSGDNETTIYIIYVDENGYAKAAPYEQEKASQASILLIPDNKNIIYKPGNEFIILKHTANPEILDKLMEYKPILIKTQKEEKEFEGCLSLYYSLVKFISNQNRVSFNQFYNENFGNIESILETTLNFLHQCLNSKPQKLPTLLLNDVTKELFKKLPTDITIKDLTVNDIIIKGYNSSLADLRDALLKNAGIEV